MYRVGFHRSLLLLTLSFRALLLPSLAFHSYTLLFCFGKEICSLFSVTERFLSAIPRGRYGDKAVIGVPVLST